MAKEEFRLFDLNPNFSISSHGRIVNNQTGEFLKFNSSGRYLRVLITVAGKKRYFSVHRLIAYVFLGLDIFNSDILVLHDDDDKLNNNLENLKLGDAKLNAEDAKRNGKFRTSCGDEHYRSKITKIQKEEIQLLYSKGGIAQRRLGEIYGVGQDHISRIINNKERGR